MLREPAAEVDVMELGENGMGLVLRVYSKPDDFWALRPALNKRVKLEFDQRNLTIPLPQLDLHVNETAVPNQAKPILDA